MPSSRRIGALALSVIIMAGASCSLPNLETAECAEARNTVKRFYSLHFANELSPNAEYLKEKDQLISGLLREALPAATDQDYFTKTADFPKAFRVGTCTSRAEGHATLQVVLLWRNDTRNDQAEVNVNTIKTGNNWLIEGVEK
jgi:hypothetical protein